MNDSVRAANSGSREPSRSAASRPIGFDPGRVFREFAQRLSDEAIRYAEKAKREGGMEGLLSCAVGEALMRAAHMANDTASAITETHNGN